MPAMELSHWMAKVTAYLGHVPEPGGVEEEYLKSFYPLYDPYAASFWFKKACEGPPAKERIIHHF